MAITEYANAANRPAPSPFSRNRCRTRRCSPPSMKQAEAHEAAVTGKIAIIQRQKTVVVVDDDPTVLTAIGCLLGSLGFPRKSSGPRRLFLTSARRTNLTASSLTFISAACRG